MEAIVNKGNLALLLLGGCGLLAACSAQAPVTAGAAGEGARLAIAVAPLSLPGVTDACYTLSVFAGADPTTGAEVMSKAHVCASQYGDNAGAVSFVGTCDASGDGASSVRLVMEDLCAGGACPATAGGANSIPATEWRNPCPGPGGCVKTATCRPNADEPVGFDLTVARAANQGFFDVAVSFSDVFCSAKLDCQGTNGQPLELLFDPDTGKRGQTAVVAWACTAGPDGDTWLYYDNVVLRCFDPQGQPAGEWAYDPSLGPGNTGAGAAPFIFQTATYRTVEATNGVVSWNMAFGILPGELPGRCTLSARATASDGALTGNSTTAGAVYPYVQWEVELSSAEDTLSCGKHALDVDGSGVTTEYTRTGPETFTHALKRSAGAPTVTSLGRTTCGGTIAALANDASFGVQDEGVTARIGNEQSPFYKLGPGLTLGDCCGDPCCTEPQ
ncbi:MAG: hypothetical protein H6745_20370 [Deltaproteobacteria bacterium]|nr:hypothetical protein [Deltaproteobacteria bacterium]